MTRRTPANVRPAGAEELTWDELERRTGASRPRLERLVELGVLAPRDGERPFSSPDVLRVRAVAALEDSGVALEEVGEAIATEQLSLGYLDYVAQPPPLLDRTQGALAAELGIPFDVLERVYLAFGLPLPVADDPARADDAEVARGIKLLIDALDEADVLHSARVFGDSLRRVAEYQVHLFHTRIEERFRQAGVPEPLVLDTALREVGVHTTPLGELFASWLYRRHSETFTAEHRVLHGEADLERAGIRRRAGTHPPAIVFLDLSGYTRLTEELGDEASAEMPMRLAVLVQEATARHGGRTLKWIGDGVEVYFPRPRDAVLWGLELCERVAEADVPPAHVGVNAGPLVYENGDFYGRTVNIAARIAAHATAGQVLVSDAVVAHVDDERIRFAPIGPVAFKGVVGDVVVHEALRA